MSAHDLVVRGLTSAADNLGRLSEDPDAIRSIVLAADLMADALRTGNKVMTCGNGGSMCDAIHFAEELTGNFRRRRPPLAALAFQDVGHLSCVANDYGYDQVFARAVTALGRPGDVLVGISTSGASASVVAALQAARLGGMRAVALTGVAASPAAATADLAVVTPGGGWADRVQEQHAVVIHLWVELIEQTLGVATRQA